MPWLEDIDNPAARAWAQFEVLADQVYAALKRGDIVNDRGEGKRLLDDYTKLRRAQIVYARELGMTPSARAVIKATGTRAAFDLVGAMASAEPAETTEDADGGDGGKQE